MLKRTRNSQIHYVERGKNQLADELASKELREPIIGAIKLEEPRFQGAKNLQDVMGLFETREPPSHLTTGDQQ